MASSRGLVFQAGCQYYAITTIRMWVFNTTYTNKIQLDLDTLQNHPIPSHPILTYSCSCQRILLDSPKVALLVLLKYYLVCTTPGSSSPCLESYLCVLYNIFVSRGISASAVAAQVVGAFDI